MPAPAPILPDTALRSLRWDAEGDRRLADLAADNWLGLLAEVEEGGGLPLLSRRLRRAGLKPPPAIATQLRVHAMAVAARTLQAHGVLADALAAVGRPMLLLKGFDLADRLYGNAGHRQMGDVDFLVHGEDAMAYHAYLASRGFVSAAAPDEAMRLVDWQRHVIYKAPGPGELPFELHWRLAGRRHGSLIDTAGIWSRSLPHASLAGGRVMAPEDLFLYLCLHLQQHVFEAPLTSLWDIAELLDCPALPLDWQILRSRADEWSLNDTVAVTLHLVERTLGVPTQHLWHRIPDSALAAMLPDGPPSLGRFSSAMPVVANRLGQALGGGAGWRARSIALLRGIVPTRLEVRTRYGRPEQGLWADLGSYAKRFRAIAGGRSAVLFAWATNKGNVRRSMDRINRLRARLDRQR